jgi:sister chromatid cohesion protein DCC1
MRSIGLSNTILVVTPVQDDYASNFANDALAIRDQVSEIMELIPAVPKMHKLTGLLRERQYDDSSEDDIYEEDGTVCLFVPLNFFIGWPTLRVADSLYL